ncbi:MAG TPA: beta-ketoacyl synthase N-terminal-like domain-containing protein [Polyangiales bacterium]|nr:beta-ketoacyl synthase N-terminal-like domain-containing protein [Polyangiales bacterium]
MNASPAYAITAYTGASALGTTREACLAALYAGGSGLAASRFAEPLETALGSMLDPLPRLPAQLSAYDTRLARMAVLLSEPMQPQLAAAISRHGASRVGIVVASSTGGLAASELAFRAKDLPDTYSFERSHAFYALVEVLRGLSGARGPGYVVSTACSSGNKVFGSAQRLLGAGIVDAVLVGGIDTLCQVTVRGFHSLGILSAEACRPFARERDGTSIGEGGALFLIERGVAAAVSLCGVGECSDAHHMTQPAPDGSGAAAAMRLALEDAGLDASQIDHLNAHGTGTQLNDAAEARAIESVLGLRVPVVSTKGATGHMLGAGAAMEAVFALAAIERGLIPPSLGCEPRDPEIKLAISEGVREHACRYVMSNALAFGGSNASVIFGASI